MTNNEYTWNMDKDDPTLINIYHDETDRVMQIYLGEAMEVAGRNRVMRIVNECDNSPWLLYWHNNTLMCSAKEIK